MKYSRSSNHSLLAVEWHTPIGRMEGLLGPEGWLGLSLPPEAEAGISAGRRVEWTSLSWLRDGGFLRPSPAMLRDIAELTHFLESLFAGVAPDVSPRIALAPRSLFEAAVWRELGRVPFGSTVTYGELAARVGRPRGARAVGQVMRRNPLVLITPCHRVLASGAGVRRLGGFTGGLEVKRFLLGLEGSHPALQSGPPHSGVGVATFAESLVNCGI